jgi:hypothetical protein
MQYKELKAEFDSLSAVLAASTCPLRMSRAIHRMRALFCDLNEGRATVADAAEFLSRHKLYDAASLDGLTPWEITVAAAEELEALNCRREPVADAARALFLDYGFSKEQLIWGDREAIIGKAVHLARQSSQRIDVMVMSCKAWASDIIAVVVKEAAKLAVDYIKTRERTADSARFIWLYGTPLFRGLLLTNSLAPDLIATNADNLQKLRGKAADAAQWLYMNSNAEPSFVQAFLRRSDRANILCARGLFV